ncbi:MAG: GNAT family N-acetyltransferase [Polyangiaceae bacterium]
MNLSILPDSLDGDTARALIAELNAELDSIYPPDANFFALAPEEVDTGAGIFLVVRADGEAVGCGAIRKGEGGYGEVKRMYVKPAWRGRGVARALLGALEGHARTLGIRTLRLETGNRQPEAMGLYERCGYARIEAFGEYVGAPFSVCYAKRVDVDAPPA